MDKAKKKQIKKIITWVLLATLVAGLAAMPLLAKAEAEADGPVATVHSGTVEEGSVRTSLHGGGTLKTEGVEDVKLPTGVKITEFLVRNGEYIKAGTPLAAVDKVSVMTAITSVTDTMDYLQAEMQSSKNEKIDSTITATAGGRIKKVFARKGDSVQDVMLEHGALALLSLDGLMAVEIEKKLDILTGENVTVTLPDKEEVTGRVASNLDGIIVITLEDKGYAIGETVSVTKKDGSEVGSGELYVHNAWTATAFSGIIQSVYAKEETKISSGATLFTLTDTDFHGKLEYMSSLHREYEELMQDLFRMYNSGTIDAPCDGTISGIDKDSPHLLAAEMDENPEASLLTAEEGSWKIVLLSEIEPVPIYADGECGSETCSLIGEHTVDNCPMNICTQNADCSANPDRHDSGCIFSCDHGATADKCNGTGDAYHHYTDCIYSCTLAENGETCRSEKFHHLSCVNSCTASDGTTVCPATGDHLKICIRTCTHANPEDPKNTQCPGTLHHYPDCVALCITSDSGSKTCPASVHYGSCYFANMEYTGKVALVSQVGANELIVRWDSSNKDYKVIKTGSGWKFESDQGFHLDLLVNSGKISVSNPSAYKPGDVILAVTGYKNEIPVWSGIPVFMHISGGKAPDLDLDLSGLAGLLMPQIDLSALLGGFNFGFYAPSPVEEDKLFDLEGSTLMTVSPQDTVSLIINLDEQDIAEISVGQEATVKVEALPGARFEATVTEVANRGSNSGGSSKFTAKLELSKTKDMLDGMSATASIPLEERTSIPTIPVVALAEQGTQTVVCTALDEDGKPSNPVPVTIGISDGLTAEILEGLEIGDTYYYSYYDVLVEDIGVEDRFTLT